MIVEVIESRSRNELRCSNGNDSEGLRIRFTASRPATGARRAVGGPAGMAGDSGGRLLGEQLAGGKSGRGDLPSVLRGARRVVSSGGRDHYSCLHRPRGE